MTIFHEVYFHKDPLEWKTLVKIALPCDLAIAQKLTSKLLYLVGFHFKILRHVVASKPCQNINLADVAGRASHGGLLPTWSATAICHVLSDMCQQKSTIITYFKYVKHSMKMITSIDIKKQSWIYKGGTKIIQSKQWFFLVPLACTKLNRGQRFKVTYS